MEIAQFLGKSSVQIDFTSGKQFGGQEKSSTSFNEYLSSFLNSANELRQSRNTASLSTDDIQRVAKAAGIEIDGNARSLKDGGKINPENIMNLEPMSPEEQEAFERIAVLVADGSLDSEQLSELSEEEMADVAAWVLAGAGGLFEPYVADIEPLAEDTSASGTDLFGLEKNLEALEQLRDVYSRIDSSDLTSSDSAMIGDLINIDEMDPVDVDKISAAILQLAEKYAAGAENASAAEVTGEDVQMNLRDMLNTVPEEELSAAVKSALVEIGTGNNEVIDELPETVLKSLCIEVVNVNNKMLDAAEFNSKLLDGLNNNSDLREQILQRLSESDAGDELIEAAAGEVVAESREKVTDVLAEAVLEDSTDDEIETLSQEMAADSGMKMVEGEEAVKVEEVRETDMPQESAAAESEAETAQNIQPVQEKTVSAAAAQTMEQDIEKSIPTENVQKEQVKSETEEPLKTEPETLKDTARDVLTGRAYSGDNETPEEEMSSGDEGGSEEESTGSESGPELDEIVSIKEEAAPVKDDFIEQFVESDSRAEFKSAPVQTAPAGYTADNPYVRYQDMMENIDRLSKLMVSSAEKSMKSVTMELSPPELGKMTIEVSVKAGQANAAIKVETDGAKQMLLNNVEQLKQNMEAHGIKLENFEVELNKQDQQQRDQQNAFAQMQQNMGENESEGGRRSGRTKSGRGGAGEIAESDEAAETRVVREDGSVDVVA